MATYSTNFADYALGTPAGWTARWVTSGTTWTIAPLAEATGGKVLRGSRTATGRSGLSWDAIDADGDRDDVEVLLRVRILAQPNTNGGYCGPFGRGSGAAASETMYTGLLSIPSTVQSNVVGEYNGGAFTAVSSQSLAWHPNTWYWIRFRINGSDLKMRRWTGPIGSEPGTWNIETTDATISAAGWVGFFLFSQTTYDVDSIGVGTNGDTAPSPTADTTDTYPALAFNGTTSSIACGSDTDLDNLHDAAFTAEAWVQALSAGEGSLGRIFDKAGWQFMVTSTGGGIRPRGFIDCATTDASADSAAPMSARGWYHVAMTWDDASFTTPKLWLNGEEVALQNTTNRSGAVVSDASDNLIRGNNAAGSRAFDGFMGWARISNNLRYTAKFTPPSRFETPAVDGNTVLLHPTEEGTGTSLADDAGNGAGTITDCDWVVQKQGEYATSYTLIVASDTTNARFSARVPHQRSNFYAKGRSWAFYGDYDASSGPYDLYFTSSTDGITWATPTNLTTFPLADAQWSVHYDETYDRLHIAKNIQQGSNPFHDGIYYRLGTPETDGTITWADDWQTAIATGNGVGDFSLHSDSTGLVWIGYGTGDTTDTFDGTARATKNSATDGTWSTASGFPTDIKAGVSQDAFAILAPLDDGTMIAAVYEWQQDEPSIAYHIAADGTVTTDENPVTASNVEAASGSGAKVARIECDSKYDGEVHLVYQDTSQNIKYKKRASNGTWSSETTLSTSAAVDDVTSSPRLSFGQSGYIYVTWSTPSAIYICTYNGSSWYGPIPLRIDGLESTFEHSMPSHTAHENTLLLTHLDSTFGTIVHQVWVANGGGGVSADVPVGLIAVSAIAPTSTKRPSLSAAVAEVLGLSPSGRKSAALLPAVAEVAANAPTSTKRAALSPAVAEVIGVVPSGETAGDTDIPIGALAVLGLAPTSSKAAGVDPAGLAVAGNVPTGLKLAGVDLGAVEIVGVAPGSAKAAALLAGIVVVVGVAVDSTGGVVVEPKFPGGMTFDRVGLRSTFSREGLKSTFERGGANA